MKCPHCGALMTDEQVFCESCGKERQLVPVYEAEIDDTIKDAISGIKVDLANTQEIKPVRLVPEDIKELMEVSPEEETESAHKPERKGVSLRFLVFMLGCVLTVVLLVVLVVTTFQMREQSSYDYHIKKAEEMSRLADYEQMLVHAEEARDIAPNSSDAKMLIARAYQGMGNEQYEREMLEDLLAVDSAYAPAYELLVPLYEDEQEYQKIADLLAGCKQQTVLDKYVDYVATSPQMSEEPGTYETAVSLKLLAPGNGKMFYTLNGADPIKHGKEYMTPILLSSGQYTVKAVYVNAYQIYSQVVQAEYYIDEQIMQAPVITPESGTYTEPQYIMIDMDEVNYQVYYTTDGSEPDMESSLYEGAIPIPIGESRFAFAFFDEAGRPGEISYAEYNFSPDLAFTGEQASNMLIQTLISQGELADADGHLAGVEGKRQYEPTTVIAVSDIYYYLLEEYFTSPDGISQKTGNYYAVSSTTGESFRAQRNSMGTFELRKIQ